MDFPSELVRLISAYQPIDLRVLRDDISGLENQISNLRTEITTDKEWKRDFQSKLELQAKNIDKLLAGLDEEKENRLAADKVFADQLGDLKTMQARTETQGKTSQTLYVALVSIILTFLLTAVISFFVAWLVTRK